MEILAGIYFFLPVLVAFIVLWLLDSILTRRVGSRFIIDLIEVCVALIILAIGEAIVLYFLFSQ